MEGFEPPHALRRLPDFELYGQRENTVKWDNTSASERPVFKAFSVVIHRKSWVPYPPEKPVFTAKCRKSVDAPSTSIPLSNYKIPILKEQNVTKNHACCWRIKNQSGHSVPINLKTTEKRSSPCQRIIRYCLNNTQKLSAKIRCTRSVSYTHLRAHET